MLYLLCYGANHAIIRLMSFGDFIKAKREAAGLEVEEASVKAGVSKWYWYNLENGSRKEPTVTRAKRMADAVGADLEEFLAPEEKAAA